MGGLAYRTVGRLKAEFAAGPGQRGPQRGKLHLPDSRAPRRGREACPRSPVSGQERRVRAAVREERLGGRSALVLEARKPRREVETRVPHGRTVPVDEERLLAAEAEVVA